jgi:hypothetical protein
MGWTSETPHGKFLLAAMDALEELGPGLYFIQGGGQATLGTAWCGVLLQCLHAK